VASAWDVIVLATSARKFPHSPLRATGSRQKSQFNPGTH